VLALLVVKEEEALQPSELREEEAIHMAITQSELDELAKWQALPCRYAPSAVQAYEGSASAGPPQGPC
jgi:hypothetical protein